MDAKQAFLAELNGLLAPLGFQQNEDDRWLRPFQGGHAYLSPHFVESLELIMTSLRMGVRIDAIEDIRNRHNELEEKHWSKSITSGAGLDEIAGPDGRISNLLKEADPKNSARRLFGLFVTHGLPYLEGLSTAEGVYEAVKSNAADRLSPIGFTVFSAEVAVCALVALGRLSDLPALVEGRRKALDAVDQRMTEQFDRFVMSLQAELSVAVPPPADRPTTAQLRKAKSAKAAQAVVDSPPDRNRLKQLYAVCALESREEEDFWWAWTMFEHILETGFEKDESVFGEPPELEPGQEQDWEDTFPRLCRIFRSMGLDKMVELLGEGRRLWRISPYAYEAKRPKLLNDFLEEVDPKIIEALHRFVSTHRAAFGVPKEAAGA